MKYVKLTAKPDTWFKEGTEVYCYDCREDNKKRITLESYEKSKSWNYILCRGTRVSEDEGAEGVYPGEEYFDGESCLLDEFNVEIVEDEYKNPLDEITEISQENGLY